MHGLQLPSPATRAALGALLFSLGAAACGAPAEPDAETSSGGESTTNGPAISRVDPTEGAAPTSGARPPMTVATPADVGAPPPNAGRTPSGLASRVLFPGTGTRHVGPLDTVTVHYVGWRAEDGVLFDASISRGEPFTARLDHLIAGWVEGIGLMVEGERRRLWIPADLAYGTHPRPGAPAGMLVFDVELIRIGP